MDNERGPMNGPTEKTYILQEAPANSETQDAETKRSHAASQLPEFNVPKNSVDSETPRVTQWAFPASAEAKGETKGEKSSLPRTVFNYVNSIVGSGVIGMSYALKQTGIGFGILLMIIVAVATDYSLIMLVKSGEIAGVATYQDLVREAFGKPGYILQSLFQILYPFICLISYNIIVGDTMTKVLIRLTGISPMSVLVRREFIITTTTLLITIPLSLYRNVSRLAKVSLMSIGIVVIILVSMIYRAVSMRQILEPTPDAWNFASTNFSSGIGIMCFAFMCNHFCFLIYDSLQDNSQPRWSMATHTSVFISLILTAIFGIAGFTTFTGHSQGDIFENYCWNDELMNFCRGCYAISILLTFPIECFVCRDVLENFFFSNYQPQPFFRHAALTVGIALLALLLSLTTDCLGIVLVINGLFTGVPLGFILPPLCYIRLQEGPPFCKGKYIAWCILICGLIVLINGCISIVINYDELNTCSHDQELYYCANFNNITL